MYCIVLYLQPVLNPKSYDGARVLEASGRPLLVKGRSYGFVSIQEGGLTGETDDDTINGGTMKLADEMTEYSVEGTKPEERVTGELGTETGTGTGTENRSMNKIDSVTRR